MQPKPPDPRGAIPAQGYDSEQSTNRYCRNQEITPPTSIGTRTPDHRASRRPLQGRLRRRHAAGPCPGPARLLTRGPLATDTAATGETGDAQSRTPIQAKAGKTPWKDP
jgi:hypothetical protein